jgi:putative glutamine amidotransferase
MKKVLIVNDGNNVSVYHRPFSDFGKQVYQTEILWTDPDSVALVVFTGGQDVSPSLYGQEASRDTFCVPRRDIYESITFHKAKSLNKPMIGICRGAQFLCVMAGGKLCQHLDGHHGSHDINTFDGKCFEVTSTHHQMMLPTKDTKIIAWASRNHSSWYWSEKNEQIRPTPRKEYEVLAWPLIRAVGMQYHPEAMDSWTKGFKFAGELVDKYLMNKS